ncbi:MAG TPA: Glu/Leu/Phe/Val dehydrogenase dimerization domain-containing protein [Longimicrobiales bacterium]|nr:Glu/Leu/Phe/Val dehydrogenase dimerization domain-containing protein [Longimicrobiales bacterium]
MSDIWQRYRRYLEARPHMVVEWHDPPTGAQGWLIMNSLRGGAAGGGTRLRKGLTREEVMYLAKGMELKFAFSGPQIGGAKSGIDFDPADPRKREVLRRWFRAMRPLLLEVYGTGGDVNVDEHRDVLPLCQEMGLAHPQQGIVQGHLAAKGASVEEADASLRDGLSLPVEDPVLGLPGTGMCVSDFITGYGVARAAARALAGEDARRPDCLDGVRVVVEGFGNVGGPAALYLARLGARVVGITDATSGLVAPQGLEPAEVEDLLRRRDVRDLPDHPLLRTGAAREEAYSVAADLFVPAAVSASMDAPRLAQLQQAGVRSLVCGANQPIRESRLGDTRNLQAADGDFSIVADVVGSMGMARAFHHLMADGPAARPEEVFDAVRTTMEDSVAQVVARRGGFQPGLVAETLAFALDRVGFPE